MSGHCAGSDEANSKIEDESPELQVTTQGFGVLVSLFFEAKNLLNKFDKSQIVCSGTKVDPNRTPEHQEASRPAGRRDVEHEDASNQSK